MKSFFSFSSWTLIFAHFFYFLFLTVFSFFFNLLSWEIIELWMVWVSLQVCKTAKPCLLNLDQNEVRERNHLAWDIAHYDSTYGTHLGSFRVHNSMSPAHHTSYRYSSSFQHLSALFSSGVWLFFRLMVRMNWIFWTHPSDVEMIPELMRVFNS